MSNYGVHHLDELEDYIKELEEKNGKGKGGKISIGQWEVHPWLEREDIVEWCSKRGVVVEVRNKQSHLILLKLITLAGILSSRKRNQIRRIDIAAVGEEISKDTSTGFDPLESAEGNVQIQLDG